MKHSLFAYLGSASIFMATFLTVGCNNEDIDDVLAIRPSEVGAVAFLMKNDKPFIMVNMTPERARFDRWSSDNKKRYLRQRAIEIVREYAISRAEYDNHETFVMRMVFLNGKDDYDRPKWGNATDAALFELNRKDIQSLGSQNLAKAPSATIEQVFRVQEFK